MSQTSRTNNQSNLLLTMTVVAGATACGGIESTEPLATGTAALTTANVYRSTTGPVPPKAVLERDASKRAQAKSSLAAAAAAAETVISGVPPYLWRHGCGPTAVGMVVGYYDAKGYSLIDGDALSQTGSVNQAIASGGDDSTSQLPPGSAHHFEDYALPYDGTDVTTDAYLTAGRKAHINDSVADYMNTSRSTLGLRYGWSYDSDLEAGLVGFVQQKASTITVRNTYYPGSYMTWSVLTQEINAQRPMVFLVDTDGDGGTDHFVAVVGYRESPNRQYASWDTWSTTVRWEDFKPIATGVPWGVYSGHAFELSGANCTADRQCNDDVACTVDRCVSGRCSNDRSACGCFSNSDCDDGNFCNGIETCVSNACVPGTSWGAACSQATLFARYQNSGNFNTASEKWFYTTDDPYGWWASNIQGRTLRVNGQVVTSGSMPLPAPINGRRYFQFTAGSSQYTSWGFW